MAKRSARWQTEKTLEMKYQGEIASQKKDVQDRRTWFTDLEVDGEIWNLTYMEERKREPLRQNVTRNMP